MTKNLSLPTEEVMRSESEVKFIGVRKRKWGKYVSEIRLPKSRERIWLGSYESAVKAARAFDAAQFCLRGTAGNFNFPENLPDISVGMSMSPEEIQAAATRFAHAQVDMDETVSYSPSISGESTVQVESEVSGVEESFFDELTSTVKMESEVSGVEKSFFDELTSTVKMESEVSGVEKSFYEELSTVGSGNYGAEFGFGYLPGFDEFTMGTFFSPRPQLGNFDIGEDFYDASIYQDSSLWNF